MGLSAAYTLKNVGHNVTIFDPDKTNNASTLAGGMLAPYSEIEHLPNEWMNAAKSGLEFWRGKADFQQNGTLLIAHGEDRHMLERSKTHLPPSAAQEKIVEPELQTRFANSVFLPEEAHINPQSAMEFLARNQTMIPETVQPVTLQNAYDWIIDARGMGAEDDKELRGVKGETLIVHNTEFTLERPVRMMHPRYPLYIVPRENHVFMIGATQVESAENTGVSLRSGMELMSALYSLHKSFGEAEILEIKAGIRPAYPDNLPRITIKENIIICNGLFRHGYLLAPIMARCAQNYIEENPHEFFSLFTRDQHENYDQRPGKNIRRAA